MQKIVFVFLFLLLTTSSHSQKIRVVENSKIAKMISGLIGYKGKYAITFGRTVFVNCTKDEFYAQPWWVRHELTHVRQYKEYGILGFLERYIGYSLFHKYDEIPFEKEAISAEWPTENDLH
ncbi:MAG: DUF4157 domain-containing protein [Bacteroidetes bacterium]|jgi:hypothetical protein|nr:MAG: DUF4157 domain-containing protein [Bacteroidota bacterium]